MVDKFKDFICYEINEAAGITKERFIERAKEIHGDKYDYSEVEYVNNKTKVVVICKKHNAVFTVRPCDHIRRESNSRSGPTGCPLCARENSKSKQLKPQDVFIEQAKEVHGENRYNYDKVDYVSARTKVTIVCPEHGDFPQRPFSHLAGHGCPHCNSSKLEIEVHNVFPKMEQQKKFNWLKKIRNLSLDFYDDNLKLAIECQGEQHFRQIESFESVEMIQERDRKKYELCKDNNIDLIYYFPKAFEKYNVYFYSDKICFNNIDDLKKYIEERVRK